MEHLILAAIAVFFAFKLGKIMGRDEMVNEIREYNNK